MTAKLTLKTGETVLIDAENFDRLSAHNWRVGRSGHVSRSEGKATVYLHREVLSTDAEDVDHINRDPLDCRRANLRACTHQDNMRNRRRWGQGEYRGVYPHGKKWRALIMVNYRQINCGSFASPIEAAVAYDAVSEAVGGEFASLNFSPKRDWLFPFDAKATRERALIGASRTMLDD